MHACGLRRILLAPPSGLRIARLLPSSFQCYRLVSSRDRTALRHYCITAFGSMAEVFFWHQCVRSCGPFMESRGRAFGSVVLREGGVLHVGQRKVYHQSRPTPKEGPCLVKMESRSLTTGSLEVSVRSDYRSVCHWP